MDLADTIWKTLKGGYKVPYDVSIPLKQLKNTTNEKEIDIIWQELWQELHHQGDVGVASYLAVPQIIKISVEKQLYNYNVLAICSVIEQQRHNPKNPKLPEEYFSYYHEGLKNLKELVIKNLKKELDYITYTCSLSALATCDGQIELGKAILQMEDKNILDEFLEQF
jgi:hypothetical protein